MIVRSPDVSEPLESSSCRPIGLDNIGNTCFCNAVLQALTFCEPLYEEILKSKLNETTQRVQHDNTPDNDIVVGQDGLSKSEAHKTIDMNDNDHCFLCELENHIIHIRELAGFTSTSTLVTSSAPSSSSMIRQPGSNLATNCTYNDLIMMQSSHDNNVECMVSSSNSPTAAKMALLMSNLSLPGSAHSKSSSLLQTNDTFTNQFSKDVTSVNNHNQWDNYIISQPVTTNKDVSRKGLMKRSIRQRGIVTFTSRFPSFVGLKRFFSSIVGGENEFIDNENININTSHQKSINGYDRKSLDFCNNVNPLYSSRKQKLFGYSNSASNSLLDHRHFHSNTNRIVVTQSGSSPKNGDSSAIVTATCSSHSTVQSTIPKSIAPTAIISLLPALSKVFIHFGLYYFYCIYQLSF